MNVGRFIAIVGPSGVGKDSVMAGIKEALPEIHLVKRVVTRAPSLGGEDYESVSVDRFRDMVREGCFVVHWGAHGLHYGIPKKIENRLAGGSDCLANLSRTALSETKVHFPNLKVLNITASPAVLATRLAARGRETSEDIEKRLSEAQKPLPDGLDVVSISNNGPLKETVDRAVAALQPVRA